jgi:stress response protein YsnF
MAKVKGQTRQERVVIEHVTVANGGRAIVGVSPRKRECQGELTENPV